MKQIWVYADMDWTSEPVLVGILGMESLRGNAVYSFQFDKNWLRENNSIFLDPDLMPYPGIQFTKPNRDIFGCFSDALPDRWGRTLLNRKEQVLAQEEQRAVKKLTSFDYLVGLDDLSRMGAFRFKSNPAEGYINDDGYLTIPPIARIRELVVAAQAIEISEQKNLLPEKRWLQQLLRPGSSLGGARPKASVVDEEKNLFMAKFPSRKDDYDVALWEHWAHLLAKRVGIKVAETSVLKLEEKYHTLLSKRFDRTKEGKRVHFASAMTMLGLTDGDNAENGYGYLDIVEFLVQYGRDIQNNLEELYRRVAFNICIGNADDHFRNHGFLLRKDGWELSPAYDLNPTLGSHLSLLINESSNETDLNLLYEASSRYLLSKEKARSILTDVVNGCLGWESLALSLGIAPRDISFFSDRMNRTIKDWKLE